MAEDDQQRRIAFFAKTADCDDLNDYLQELVDHVAENTGATAVYLGKITKPIKGIAEGLIKEDDNDEAHLMPDAQDRIEFIHSSKDFKYLEGKLLQQNEGITYRLFKEEFTHATNADIIDQNEQTGAPKHIFVKDVVRNKDMFYYRVPRMGSYLCIKLEYKSCLYEEAYDAAVENYKEVDEKNVQQQEEKKAWEEEQAEI